MNEKRFGKPQNWGFIQMYAKQFFKYLEISPIPIVKTPMDDEPECFAFYRPREGLIKIKPHGYSSVIIKHEICHYLHHLMLMDAKFQERIEQKVQLGTIDRILVWLGNDFGGENEEELHTIRQESHSWKQIKEWKDTIK